MTNPTHPTAAQPSSAADSPSLSGSLSDQIRLCVRAAMQCGTSIETLADILYRSKYQRPNVERFLAGGGLNLRSVERLLAGFDLAVALLPAGPGVTSFRPSVDADDPSLSLMGRLRQHLLTMLDSGYTLSDVSYVFHGTISGRETTGRFLHRGGGMTLLTADRIIPRLGLKVVLVPRSSDAPEQLPTVLWRETGSSVATSSATPADSIESQ